jgi:hypothetical protein
MLLFTVYIKPKPHIQYDSDRTLGGMKYMMSAGELEKLSLIKGAIDGAYTAKQAGLDAAKPVKYAYERKPEEVKKRQKPVYDCSIELLKG